MPAPITLRALDAVDPGASPFVGQLSRGASQIRLATDVLTRHLTTWTVGDPTRPDLPDRDALTCAAAVRARLAHIRAQCDALERVCAAIEEATFAEQDARRLAVKS